MSLTILRLEHQPVTVAGDVYDDVAIVSDAHMDEALGWTLKPEGLCQGDVCVPVQDRATLRYRGRLNLAAVASAVGWQAVVDESGVVAVGPSSSQLERAMTSMKAPAFTLPDLEGNNHSLDEYSGKKKMLLTFSSWCGCRYDLPAWKDFQNELGDEDFTIVAVAMDENPADVAPFVPADSPYPVLIDRDHVLSEKYGVVNVPTVVWIDEHDEIIKPADVAFGDDQFKDFHGVESSPHKAALRAWVTEGRTPMPAAKRSSRLRTPTADEEEARLWFRVALHLRRSGDNDGAERNFQRAFEKAPIEDFTIRRAAMPLRGEDPFGEKFFELYEDWKANGQAYYPQGD